MHKNFFANSKIVENYALLEEIGIFDYMELLEKEISNYKNLYAGALDIVNRATISEIMDATVWQMTDYFLPTLIVFLYKPLQNKEDITIKCYKNYKLIDMNLPVDNISAFETFFRKHPEPVSYKLLSSKVAQNETLKAFKEIEPELIIPILGPSGLYGLILLGRNILGADYTKRELAFIQNLMAFISKAIQNNLHYERTLRDTKTGLYNNGFFVTRLSEEITRTKRANSVTSIIIMDVDHFKVFNDTYGHLAGDRVLETLAITIKQGVRLGDVPSRFGGEEFTVLLPDTDKELAWVVAERLRIMVESMEVAWESPLPNVNVSLGIFTFDKSTNLDVDEVMKRADEALYYSKRTGRNRTTLWDTNLPKKITKIKPAK